MHLLCIGGVLANKVGEDAHWHVRPVVLFEHILETGGGTFCDQHDGLVTLASLTRTVVLEIGMAEYEKKERTKIFVCFLVFFGIYSCTMKIGNIPL